MQCTSPFLCKPLCAGVLGLLLLAAAPPGSAAPAAAGESARYQRERGHCMNFRDHGQRANCLSEASTAHHARLPPVPDPDPGRYERNAMERCKPLPDADRQDCLQRMRGQGTTSGSVAGGGIYRDLVTVTPAPAASAPR